MMRRAMKVVLGVMAILGGAWIFTAVSVSAATRPPTVHVLELQLQTTANTLLPEIERLAPKYLATQPVLSGGREPYMDAVREVIQAYYADHPHTTIRATVVATTAPGSKHYLTTGSGARFLAPPSRAFFGVAHFHTIPATAKKGATQHYVVYSTPLLSPVAYQRAGYQVSLVVYVANPF